MIHNYTEKIKKIKDKEVEEVDDFLESNLLPFNKNEKKKRITKKINKINELDMEQYLKHYLIKEKIEKNRKDKKRKS